MTRRVQCRWLLAVVALVAASPAGADEPRRIVSLAPSVTEIVFALGAGDRLVGATAQCDEPAEARAVDRVGTFLTPNVELVMAKQPDLVLAVPSPGNRRAVETLRQMGLRVVVMEPRSVAETRAAILQVAELLGRREVGESLAASFDRRLAGVRLAVEGKPAPRVLFLVGRNPLMVAGGGTLQDELITIAGGMNIGARAGSGWPRVDIEFVLAEAPDVLIDATMGSGAEENGTFWSHFAELPAVRTGRVHTASDSRLLRPGPRIPEAAELVSSWVHPEVSRPVVR